MKFLVCFFLIGFIACTDAPPKQPARPKLVTNDSGVVKAEMPNPYAPVDASPMDMAYLPVDYPKMTVKRPLPVARVIYSRPHKQGRMIFGSLVKYGEPWRMGANEATEIELFIPVSIQNKTVPKGKYVLYCIPQSDKWTIIFNNNLYSWGLKPDPSKDVFKFEIPVQTKEQSLEYYTMIFRATAGGAELIMAWDNTEARLPLQYTEK